MIDTGVDIIIGLSAIFIFWSAIITVVSSRLVRSNWGLLVRWRVQPRETRIKLALWVGTPLLFATLTWQHIVALINYALASSIPLFSILQILIYRPLMLIATALILWYAVNRAFGENADTVIDRLWGVFVVVGGLLGTIAMGLSWWY